LLRIKARLASTVSRRLQLEFAGAICGLPLLCGDVSFLHDTNGLLFPYDQELSPLTVVLVNNLEAVSFTSPVARWTRVRVFSRAFALLRCFCVS
jgi:hypothetical protein